MGKNYARKARNLRRFSVVMFVMAGVFLVLGVGLLVATGKPTSLITVGSALVIALSGISLRGSAQTYEHLAR